MRAGEASDDYEGGEGDDGEGDDGEGDDGAALLASTLTSHSSFTLTNHSSFLASASAPPV